jgi:hypothetical protein
MGALLKRRVLGSRWEYRRERREGVCGKRVLDREKERRREGERECTGVEG